MMSDLHALLDNRQMPDDTMPKVSLGALRALRLDIEAAPAPLDDTARRIDEANALGYREGYRAGRAAGITEMVDAQPAAQPELTWWDDLTPEMQDAVSAAILAALDRAEGETP